MINGILNYIYDFFNTWLFGTGANAALENISTDITALVSLIFVGVIIGVCFTFVFGAVKFVLNMFRGY